MGNKNTNTVVLGKELSLEEFMSVVRGHAAVEFSEEYAMRVNQSRGMVEKCVEEERVVYGTTTGFGALVTQTINKEQAEQLQRNIVITHAASVGEPFKEEVVRAIMLMMLQSLGWGVSGVRLKLLEIYRQFLNKNLIPYTPQEGSVGYLCAEGHIACTAIGEGRAYYKGELYDSKTALKKAGMEPIELSYKEGIALLNGTTSPTAMAAIAVYDLLRAVKTADVIASLSLESLKGLIKAYDPRIMSCRPQKELQATAENVRRLLESSEVIEKYKDSHVQDPLSLRCVPQLHGAVKRVFQDAKEVIETEINSCGDNPILWNIEGDCIPLSNGNPDASYVGLQMDASCIAATTLAKMSERRNVRFLDTNLSGHPWFLIKNPGLNSGLMVPQYAQAGLLNDMRNLSTPSTIDNVTTSANQEDYVSMGYNACRQALQIVDKLEYILAIELLSSYQAQQFVEPELKKGKGTAAVLARLAEMVPVMEADIYLYPHIESLKEWLHSGEILKIAEDCVGPLN